MSYVHPTWYAVGHAAHPTKSTKKYIVIYQQSTRTKSTRTRQMSEARLLGGGGGSVHVHFCVSSVFPDVSTLQYSSVTDRKEPCHVCNKVIGLLFLP